MSVAIHPIHRQLAEIYFMSRDANGVFEIDEVVEQQLETLLRQNFRMIQRLDELKNLSQIAYERNDVEWQHDICKRIEGLERDLFLV
ncbi:hypothetical protein PMSD_11725 [Paenibacillus macquariensis subsp. defensor]|nr:hypothetical protein PMSD_11725 [Paenibacillus macquariensis subsp. defensor]